MTRIYAALLGKHTQIATDSACLLSQIRKQLLHPELQRRHKHHNRIAAIVDLIQTSPEQVSPFKVKAHTGVIGNEYADALAKHAAMNDTGHCVCVQQEGMEGNPFAHLHWLAAEKSKETHTQNNTEGQSSGPRATILQPLSNMRAYLKAHMQERHRLGSSKADSGYYSYWRHLLTTKTADPKLSNAFWKDGRVTHAERRTVMKYRLGVLFNNKLAQRFGYCVTQKCSVCPGDDSALHILSGCQQPTISKMITERHNKAGKLVAEAIAKGAYGANIVNTDIGSADKLAADAVTLPEEATNRTLPAWLLKSLSADSASDGLTSCTRPDLILVTPSTTCPPAHDNATNPTLIPARNRDIHLVEIKYCEDSRPKGQLEHAQTQHTKLIANLTAQGCCAAVHLHVVLIGVAGTIYIPHTLEPLKRLGLDHQHASQLACRLNAHSFVICLGGCHATAKDPTQPGFCHFIQ